MTDQQFPGFPSTPTTARFPMYGVASIPGGKGYEVSVMVRERAQDGTTGDSGMAHLPVAGPFKTQKPANDLMSELNSRVWSALQ